MGEARWEIGNLLVHRTRNIFTVGTLRSYKCIYIYLEPTWKKIFWKIWPIKMEGQPPKKEVSWVLGIYYNVSYRLCYQFMESRGFTVEARSISRGQSGLAGWIHCRGGVVPLLNLWNLVPLRQSLKDWDLWPLEVENRNFSVFFKVGFWRCKNLQGWFSWGNRRHRRLVTFSRSKLWLIRWNEWNGWEAGCPWWDTWSALCAQVAAL